MGRRRRNWFQRNWPVVAQSEGSKHGLGGLTSAYAAGSKRVELAKKSRREAVKEAAKSAVRSEVSTLSTVALSMIGFAIYKPWEQVVEQIPVVQQYGPWAVKAATVGSIYLAARIFLKSRDKWIQGILYGMLIRIAFDLLKGGLSVSLKGYLPNSDWEVVPEKESA